MKNLSYKIIFFYLFLVVIIVVRLNIFENNLKKFQGLKIKINATVLKEPSRYTNSQNILLEGFSFYLPKYPQINYGDKIVIEGIAENKKLINAKLVNFERNENILIGIRKKIISFYQKNLPQPHSSLIAGIILGYKADSVSEFWEGLRKTGTMHVVVASGMNVTFVAGFLMSVFLTFFSRRKTILITLISIWIYAYISGFEAPIVRSTIMFSIVIIGQFFGRMSVSINALLLSALCMLLIKPIWIYDLGFILSFVATASLIIFSKRLGSFLRILPKYIKEDLSTTLAAQIGVAPILFVTFGEFNLFSPIINILILWTVPFIMIIGSLGGVVGLFFPLLGKLILYLAYPLTWYFVSIISIFSR